MVHEPLLMIRCFAGSVASWLTPMFTVMSSPLCRGGDHHAFGPGLEMPGSLLRIGESPGRFNHRFDAELLPGQTRRGALGEDRNRSSIDHAMSILGIDRPGKRP